MKFSKNGFITLYASLASINWADVLVLTNINLAVVDAFYSELNKTFERLVSLKQQLNPVKRYTYSPWYTSDLFYFIKLKYFNLQNFQYLGLGFNREDREN